MTIASTRTPGRRGTAEVRHALLEASAELFATKGYSGTSTKEIARAALTSETTLYRQFGSKSDLFAAAVLEPFTNFLDEYEEIFTQVMSKDEWTDQDITHRSIESLFRALRQNRNSVLAMISVHGDPDATEAARDATSRFAAFFDSLYDIGLRRWRRDPSGFDLERLRLNHRFLVSIVFSTAALDRWFVPAGQNRPTDAQLIDAISEFVLRGSVDHTHGASATPADDGAALIDRLERLADLHTRDLITDDEFTTAKRYILDTAKVPPE